jgi:hypothetical protein
MLLLILLVVLEEKVLLEVSSLSANWIGTTGAQGLQYLVYHRES